MSNLPRILILFAFLLAGLTASSQGYTTEQLKPDPARENMFLPYLAARHGGFERLQNWKNSNTLLYYKELWYFCESFQVKRNHFRDGAVLNESTVDITRFESQRKQDEQAIVVLPGMKDALILLPSKDLLYKPNFE